MSGETGGELADASSLLVLAPRLDGVGVDACADLVANVDERLDRLIVVAVGQTPGEWHARLSQRDRTLSTKIDYVDVKTLTRSTAKTTAADPPAPVATVSSPADLVTLGTSINDQLSDAADRGERVGLCLYSISEMLQFVDREFLFKFLHAVSARVRGVGGITFAHLDNETSDEKLETMFAHLCDTVVSVEGGEMTVSPGYYAPASSGSES